MTTEQQEKPLLSSESPEQKTEETPFLLKQESFSGSNLEEYKRQRQIMDSCYKEGRRLLIDKNYFDASKQFNKTVMAFEYILKTHIKSLQKSQVKTMMVETIIPCYNNLALCHLKQKNWPTVVKLCDQVLGQDTDNVKARYRKAIALKESRKYDEAIQNFELVKKMDPEMQKDCQDLQKQCKAGQIEEKRRRKEAAKKFISGYEGEKRSQEQTKTWENLNKESEKSKQLSDKTIFKKQEGIMAWIRDKCSALTSIFSKKEHHS